MSLLEPLVAAVVFTAAAAVSAQIVGMAGAASVRHGQAEALADLQDGEMLLIDQLFRRLRPPRPLPQDCAAASAWLRAQSRTLPGADGITRRIERFGDGDDLLVEVMVDGHRSSRRRLYSPAAMNLCGGDALPGGPAARAPSPPAAHGAAQEPSADRAHGGEDDA